MCFMAAGLAKPAIAAMPWFRGAQTVARAATNKPGVHGEEFGVQDAIRGAAGMAVPLVGAAQTDVGIAQWASDKVGG